MILELGRCPEIGNGKPIPGFLPGVFHGQRGLAGHSPWGHRESDMTEHVCAHTHRHTHRHTKDTHTHTHTHTHTPTHPPSKETNAVLWSYPVERHTWARNPGQRSVRVWDLPRTI